MLTFQENILYWNLQITEFIAGRQLPVSPLHYTNAEESKPTFRAHVNLPKLQIQPFDSNPLEWLTFWDSFNNTVNSNPNLHNINKMITGDAARAITRLPITSQNYDKAIGMLQERFGRKQLLTNAHMESLSKLNTPSMDVQQLLTLLHIAQLTSCGERCAKSWKQEKTAN